MEREVPDADAADQQREAFPHDEEREPLTNDREAPEADALDQATPAPVEDEERE